MPVRKIAFAISFLLHPLLVPTYVLLAIPSAAELPVAWQWTLIALVVTLTVLLPVIFTWIFRMLGMVSSWYLVSREERVYPVLAVSVCYYMTYFFLRGVHVSALFSYYMLGAALLAVLSLATGLFMKVSLHMVAAGSAVGLFLGLALHFGLDLKQWILVSLLLAGLTGSARLALEAHRPAEIYTGFAMGVAVTAGLMFLL